jgi:hypothetical protein
LFAQIKRPGRGILKKNDYLNISNNMPRIYRRFTSKYFKFFQKGNERRASGNTPRRARQRRLI